MTLLGHPAQAAAFQAAIVAEKLHHAWLLAGPKGIGKARFAETATRWLMPSETAARLLDAGSHPDFKRLERLENEKTGMLAQNITIDQIRALKSLLAGTTSQGGRRVILVDAVDDLERNAANALLKSLEEPPPSTVFLLVSHAPGRLLPTIRSRCRTLVFDALDSASVEAVLAERRPDLEEAVRQMVAKAAQGSVARALSYAEHDMGAVDATLTRIAHTGDPSNAERSALAHTLSLKAATPRYLAFLDRVPAFIADHARGASGRPLETALRQWEAASRICASAVPQSLPAEAVVFELAGHVAALARDEEPAKA